MRRIEIWLPVAAVLVALTWGLLWWIISAYVERAIGEALAASAEGGVTIACAERGRRGFPFRVEVVCSDASARAAGGAWSASLEGFRAGALVRSPRNIEANLHGPLQVSAAALDRPATADWASARAVVVVEGDAPRSLILRIFRARAEIADARLAAHQARLEVAPDEAGGSRLALVAEQLGLAAGEQALPPVDLGIEARTPIPAEALLAGAIDASEGLSVSDLALSVETAQAQAFAEGDLDIDPEGLVSGSLTLHIVGIEALPGLLEGLPEEARSGGNVLVGALMALGAPAEWRGRPARRVVLTIADGEIRAGPLSLGRLPPLWRPPVVF